MPLVPPVLHVLKILLGVVFVDARHLGANPPFSVGVLRRMPDSTGASGLFRASTATITHYFVPEFH